jgi:hypothetical protein
MPVRRYSDDGHAHEIWPPVAGPPRPPLYFKFHILLYFKELVRFYTSNGKDFVSGKQKSAIFAFFFDSRGASDFTDLYFQQECMPTAAVLASSYARASVRHYVRQELAIKPGDTLKVSIHGSSVTLTPNREVAGFVRKGKALIFTTGSHEILTSEDVANILDESRAERDALSLNFANERKPGT